MAGIKETSEMLVGVNEVTLVFVKHLKDGVQLGDFAAFWSEFQNNAEFKAKVQAAYEGASAVPSEAGDLDLSEGMQLAGIQLSYLPRIVEALK